MELDHGAGLWTRSQTMELDHGAGLWTRTMDPDRGPGAGPWSRTMDPDRGHEHIDSIHLFLTGKRETFSERLFQSQVTFLVFLLSMISFYISALLTGA